jgi:hypothetical protein
MLCYSNKELVLDFNFRGSVCTCKLKRTTAQRITLKYHQFTMGWFATEKLLFIWHDNQNSKLMHWFLQHCHAIKLKTTVASHSNLRRKSNVPDTICIRECIVSDKKTNAESWMHHACMPIIILSFVLKPSLISKRSLDECKHATVQCRTGSVVNRE